MQKAHSTETGQRRSSPLIESALRLPYVNPSVETKVFRTIVCSVFFLLLSSLIEQSLFTNATVQANTSQLFLTSGNNQKTTAHLSHESVFNFRLYKQDSRLVLRWEDGAYSIFGQAHLTGQEENNHGTTHRHLAAGSISNSGRSNQWVWIYNHSTRVEFQGSYPTKIIFTSDYKATEYPIDLRYISKSSDRESKHKHSHVVEITGDADAIANVQRFLQKLKLEICLPPKQQQEQQEQQEQQQKETVNEHCTDPSVEPPVGFEKPAADHVVRIDQRPGDCLSYFTSYPPIERGHAIEQALGLHPPYRGSESGGTFFPVADYWNQGRVYVLVSHDLTAGAFNPVQSTDGLYETLLADAEKVATRLLDPLTNGQVLADSTQAISPALVAEDAKQVFLDLVVQFGVISPAQEIAFDRAAEQILARYGITLRRIEIP